MKEHDVVELKHTLRVGDKHIGIGAKGVIVDVYEGEDGLGNLGVPIAFELEIDGNCYTVPEGFVKECPDLRYGTVIVFKKGVDEKHINDFISLDARQIDTVTTEEFDLNIGSPVFYVP